MHDEAVLPLCADKHQVFVKLEKKANGFFPVS